MIQKKSDFRRKQILTYFLVTIIVIFNGILFFQLMQFNEATKGIFSFSVNLAGIVNNKWVKNNSTADFWFPKNYIVISKRILDNYKFSFDRPIEFKVPLKKESIENFINKQKDIVRIIKGLKKNRMILNNEMTGLFNSGKDKMTPYYLMTFQNGDYWCQININFECGNNNSCLSDSIRVGCQEFDLNKYFDYQKRIYDLVSPVKKTDYGLAISEVLANSLGYKKISISSKIDGDIIILNKSDRMVCEGKTCCDESSKEDIKLWNKDWCEGYRSTGIF